MLEDGAHLADVDAAIREKFVRTDLGEIFLDGVSDGLVDPSCPPRLHFGADDPITPPEAIDKIRAAFAGHPDVSIAVHPGAVHGYALGGEAYDAEACQAGLDAAKELLESLA